MLELGSRDELDTAVAAAREVDAARQRRQVLVCCGTGCLANGAREVADAFAERLGVATVRTFTKRTGCHGFCERGPLVVVQPEGVLYTRVKAKHVELIVERTVERGEVIEALLYKNPADKQTIRHYEDVPFYKHQTRVAMRNIGRVDPEDLDDALAHGCYQGLRRALFEMTPEQVVDEVERSGLRGRGGAGFATARKWRAARHAGGERKFVLCNGDEGDPGAFKDRSIMEGDPHSVLEGLTIGGYAVGASHGIVYVRHEYPLAVTNLSRAITSARERGLLGDDILGSGFDFDIDISRGGGAFVCGESSALMRSIEGKAGEPRQKYVHATDRGLHDLPTVLNNVETWADVGAIIADGPERFAALGTERSKGTKAFSLVGKVRNTGLIELPMGTSLREIIFDIGGGILGDRPFKAVQTGGPSGGCVPEELLDLPVDYEKLTAAGSMMGSGGMIVMDEDTCMVDVARYFIEFLTDESCGKCVPCREGLRKMHGILTRITEGRGEESDLELLDDLSGLARDLSLCALGKTAANPFLSTYRYFRGEYEAHIRAKVCPARSCKALISHWIDPDKCKACMLCLKVCPQDAIDGGKKRIHVINQAKCDNCGSCLDICPDKFAAVIKISGEPVPEPIPEDQRTLRKKRSA